MLLFRLFFLVLLLVYTSGCRTITSTVYCFYKTPAGEALKDLDYEEALSLLLKDLEITPDDEYLNLYTALAYLYTDNDAEGERYLNRVLELNPKNLYARLNCGLLKFKRGHYEEALGDFSTYQRSPIHMTSLGLSGYNYYLGQIHFQMGHREEAARLFKRSKKAESLFFRIYLISLNRGHDYFLREAEALGKWAFNAEILAPFIELLVSENGGPYCHPDLALHIMTTWMGKTKSESVEAYRLWALAYAASGDYESSIVYQKKAIEQYREDQEEAKEDEDQGDESDEEDSLSKEEADLTATLLDYQNKTYASISLNEAFNPPIEDWFVPVYRDKKKKRSTIFDDFEYDIFPRYREPSLLDLPTFPYEVEFPDYGH